MYLTGGWKDSLRDWEKEIEKAVRMSREEEPPLESV